MFYSFFSISAGKEPALRDPKYRTSKGFSTESRGLYRFKVQGTDLYLTISDEQVQLEVSKYVKDMNKYSKFSYIYTIHSLSARTAATIETVEVPNGRFSASIQDGDIRWQCIDLLLETEEVLLIDCLLKDHSVVYLYPIQIKYASWV